MGTVDGRLVGPRERDLIRRRDLYLSLVELSPGHRSAGRWWQEIAEAERELELWEGSVRQAIDGLDEAIGEVLAPLLRWVARVSALTPRDKKGV